MPHGFAREPGFPQINIDLIAGMVAETDQNWRDCIRKTIEMSPDSVTIYQMEIPYNTTIYQEMKADGKLVAPVADGKQKRSWVGDAFVSSNTPVTPSAAPTAAVKDKAKTRSVYRDNSGPGRISSHSEWLVWLHRRNALSKPPRLRTLCQCRERGPSACLRGTDADRRRTAYPRVRSAAQTRQRKSLNTL